MTLTSRQKRFYELLKEFVEINRSSPTLLEMKNWLEMNNWGEIRSLNSIKQYLGSLEKENLIHCERRKRGISLIEDSSSDLIKIVLIESAVACGSPTTFFNEAEQNTLTISKKLVRGIKNVCAFVTHGDSMNKAGIDDGDFVLVKPMPTEIQNNDLVLANIDNCGTVKRFRKSIDTITLLPESSNPEHKPIYLHISDNAAIVGKIVGVLKN